MLASHTRLCGFRKQGKQHYISTCCCRCAAAPKIEPCTSFHCGLNRCRSPSTDSCTDLAAVISELDFAFHGKNSTSPVDWLRRNSPYKTVYECTDILTAASIVVHSFPSAPQNTYTEIPMEEDAVALSYPRCIRSHHLKLILTNQL